MKFLKKQVEKTEKAADYAANRLKLLEAAEKQNAEKDFIEKERKKLSDETNNLTDQLEKITNQLKFNLERLGRVGEDFYWNLYHQKLFKKDVVSTFENTMGNRFVGKIIRVSKEGKLEVLLDDDIQASFDIKEIKMLY